MSPKRFAYKDERIEDRRGSRFYLRSKYERKGSKLVMSIRTQRNGKGSCVARVQGVIQGEKTHKELLLRLAKKWRKFSFVVLVPVEDVIVETPA